VVEGGLKPGRADLAIAVFLALITLIANVTGMPYVLFPELGALGWVNFQRSAPSLGPLAGAADAHPVPGGGGGGRRGGSGGEAAVPSVGATGAGGAIGTA
jgi:hypothetical protein